MKVLNLSLAILAQVDATALFPDYRGTGHLGRKAPFFWLGDACSKESRDEGCDAPGWVASSTEIRGLVCGRVVVAQSSQE
jgi:hypothetical protein